MDTLDIISEKYEQCGRALEPVNQCSCGKMMITSGIVWRADYTLYKWKCPNCGLSKETKEFK